MAGILQDFFKPKPQEQVEQAPIPQVDHPSEYTYELVPDSMHVEKVATQPSTPDHQHRWIEKLRSVAPPRRDLPQFQTPPTSEVLEKALLGVLTVIYECELCKELYKTELLGSDKTELDDILDNVEKTGGQYYSRRDVTFVIQRYQPQQQQVTLR